VISPLRFRFYAPLTFALIGSIACSSDVTSPGSGAPCTGDVAITVSAGTTPRFTWTPACRVLGLLVEQGSSDRWFVEATGAGIGSGVTYGVEPPGGSEDGPAIPLVSGTTYDVILFRGTSEDATIAGMREFTP